MLRWVYRYSPELQLQLRNCLRPTKSCLLNRHSSSFQNLSTELPDVPDSSSPVRRGTRMLNRSIYRLGLGQIGLVSSIRQIGPSSKSAPSDFKKTGALPAAIHICTGGGCFPTTFAATPVIPPMSILMT